MIVEIPSGESGLVRVFAVNAAADVTGDLLKSQSKAQVASSLLGHPLPEGGFDLVALNDLEGVGLANYLIEGWDVPAENLEGTRTKLDALDGYALLIFSSAFEVRKATLTIGPDLTLIGTYAEAPIDKTVLSLQSDAAELYTGVSRPTSALAPKKRQAGGSLVVVILAVLAGLILWWALF